MKKYLLSLVIIVAIVPQVTFAVWWNPASWFEKSVAEEKTTGQETAPAPSVSSEQTSPTVTQQVTERVIERIIEKPVVQEKVVTKTITVDNPELQKRIDELVAENTSLKTRVNTLLDYNKQWEQASKEATSVINQWKLAHENLLQSCKRYVSEAYDAGRSSMSIPIIPVYVVPQTSTPDTALLEKCQGIMDQPIASSYIIAQLQANGCPCY